MVPKKGLVFWKSKIFKKYGIDIAYSSSNEMKIP